MRTRVWALRIVLGLLGFIAIGAVLGALSGSWDTIGRVIGTGVIGAGIGLLSIPLLGMAERPRLRVGALAALAYLGLQTVLLILGIWFMDRGGVVAGEQLLLAAGIGAVTLFPTVAALYAAPFLGSWRLPIVVILLSAIAALCTLPFLVQGPYSSSSNWEELSVFGVTLGLCDLFFLGALAQRPQERRIVGILLSLLPVAAMATTSVMIFDLWQLSWSSGRPWNGFASLMVLLWSSSVSLIVWHTLRLFDLRGWQWHLRTAFLGAAGSGSLLIAAATWIESEGAGALGSSCLVVAACILVAIAVFVRMNRRTELSTMLIEVAPGSIVCPRCLHPIELRPGAGACAACGLGFRLEMEAPRCRKCRHDVTHARSAVCSECGEPILLADAAPTGAAPAATSAVTPRS